MRKLSLIATFFISILYISAWADCVTCGNPFASVMPVEAFQLEEVTEQLPCRARVDQSSDDPFGSGANPFGGDSGSPFGGSGSAFYGDTGVTSSPSEEECGCILGKNINNIKNDYLKQGERLKQNFAKMMEARSFANMDRLTTLGQNMEMLGANLSSLVGPGGVCDLKSQFEKVSCRNQDGFQKKLADYFPMEGQEDREELSIDDLTNYWIGRGRKAVFGDKPSMNESDCLNRLDAEFIAMESKRTPDQLKLISEFINRDGLIQDFNPRYQDFDRLINEEGLSPRAALEIQRKHDPELMKLYSAFEGFPSLLFMLEDKTSFEELKGIFSGDTRALNDPAAFLSEKFSGNSNHQNTIVENMKDSCERYTKDLDMLLCGEIDNPYVFDGEYSHSFSRSIENEVFDGPQQAFRCHGTLCSDGKVFPGLEGYCLNRPGTNSFGNSFKKARADFGGNVASAHDLLQSKEVNLDAGEAKICPFLTCSAEQLSAQERQCQSNQLRGYKEVEAMIASAQCPPGGDVNADENSICAPGTYKNLQAYIAYQKKLQAAGLLVVEEVPDLTAEPDEDGVYPTTQVMTRNRKASFAEELWSLGEEEAEAPLAVKSGHLRTGDQARGGDSTVQSDRGFLPQKMQQHSSGGTARTIPQPTGNDRFARQQLEQAKRLADAAIGMAENASRISDAAVDRLEEDRQRPAEERQKLASFGAEEPSSDRVVVDGPTMPQEEPDHTQAAVVADQDSGAKAQQQAQWRRPAGSPAQELGDSVIDIADNGPVAGEVSKAEESEPADESEAVGTATRAMPTGSQTLTVNKTELPELVEERLEEQGVDVDTPFVIEVVVDGKVVKVLVEPVTVDGKTLLKPDLDQLKESDPELYEAIKNTPIFKDYLDYLRSSQEYSWGDVVKMLPTGQEKEE